MKRKESGRRIHLLLPLSSFYSTLRRRKRKKEVGDFES